MNIIVDTCGWIEWLTNGNLAQNYAPYLKKPQQLYIPTILQYELYKWICRERDEILALSIISITEQSNIIPLDTHLALAAADMSKEYGLAMADAIIYAACNLYQARLITSDKHFASLAGVEYFAK